MKGVFWKLLTAFTIIPILETYLLIKISELTSPLTAIALIIFTGTLGAALAKREGLSVLGQVKNGLSRGLPPADSIVEGFLVLIGAVLLITPGVLTDITGLMLIIPPTRKMLAPHVKNAALSKLGLKVNFNGKPYNKTETEKELSSGSEFEHPIL